jgi:hypothetical protein
VTACDCNIDYTHGDPARNGGMRRDWDLLDKGILQHLAFALTGFDDPWTEVDNPRSELTTFYDGERLKLSIP